MAVRKLKFNGIVKKGLKEDWIAEDHSGTFHDEAVLPFWRLITTAGSSSPSSSPPKSTLGIQKIKSYSWRELNPNYVFSGNSWRRTWTWIWFLVVQNWYFMSEMSESPDWRWNSWRFGDYVTWPFKFHLKYKCFHAKAILFIFFFQKINISPRHFLTPQKFLLIL